jgi:hypothetical protein
MHYEVGIKDETINGDKLGDPAVHIKIEVVSLSDTAADPWAVMVMH